MKNNNTNGKSLLSMTIKSSSGGSIDAPTTPFQI